MKRAAKDVFGIYPLGQGRYALEGELSFGSVESALRKTARIFADSKRVAFDLAAIAKADSAGLALMVEWLRQASVEGVELHYLNLPRQLSDMARVAGVDGILIID
jgi:phospholipid transport system transporter-binding protein